MFLLISAALLSVFTHAQKETVSILIDPGHGGSDPGHLPLDESGIQEKELTLEISMKVGDYLSNNLSNVEIGYTRLGDTYPSLDDRVEQANDGHYDYLLSIHINGNPKTAVRGTETIIHNYEAKDSYKWAKLIEHQFKKRAGRKSRGVKTAADLGHSLQVLKFTQIPAVVVECGFITNAIEANYLSSTYGQEIIASAIFRATREFVKAEHPEIDFTPKSDELPKEEEKNEDSEVAHYSIQIMASIDSVDTEIPQFKKLEYEVERVQIETTSLYKYRYYVGKFDSKKDARPVQKEVRANGFEDAFITYLK